MAAAAAAADDGPETTRWEWDEEVGWGAPPPPAAAPPVDPRTVADALATDVGPQEGDPLDSDVEPEPPEPAGLIEYDSGEDEDNERNFMAIKPWLGSLYPPRKYRKEPENRKNLATVFDEANNNWGLPEAKIELDYVFGYRARNCRSNAHWINDNRVVFFAGSVCIIYKIDVDDQDFYTGHDNDVICIDYHEGTGLVASGSIGARNTVRLCIWEEATQRTRHTIMGFHRFAVTSVWFNPSGTIVASLGMDEHHSVALHSVETGQLLATSQVDKNRVLQVMWNTSEACGDSESCLVTCGVKHIAFWTPAVEKVKGGKYYFHATEEIDRRLTWYRGTKCDVIDDVTFMCMESTPRAILVGANDGAVYAFNSASYQCMYHIKLGKSPVQAMAPLADRGRTIAVGTKDGFVRLYDIHDEQATPSDLVQTGRGDNFLNINMLDDATDNDSDILVNSVRSLSYHAPTKRLLVGTILSHLYGISIPKTTGSKPHAQAYVQAHWGLLSKPDGYGEIWGIDCHPMEQKLYSTSMDGTVRLWDLETTLEIERMNLHRPGMAVSASVDGKMVAVGHMNGSFTVVNHSLSHIVWPNTRHRVRRVKDVQFSPNSRFLAVAAEMHIDIYSVKEADPLKTEAGVAYRSTMLSKKFDFDRSTQRVLTRVSVCRGHTSSLRHLDWNLASTVIQSTSSGCELLYFSVPDGRRVTGARHLADQQWWSQTCEFGWSVQGIWPRFADGSDINSVGSSKSGSMLAITNDDGDVVVYNYPCIGSGMDKYGHLEHRPQGHVLRGHSSHVTNCNWSRNDKYLVTAGGGDLCIFVWKVTYANPPKTFVDAEFVRKMQAMIDEAMRKKGGAGDNPLSTGVIPKDVLMTDDPEERIRRLQERISQKQRPDIPPAECSMCAYVFVDEHETTCPRCLMPRKIQRGAEDPENPSIVKAPKPKKSKSQVFVDGFKAEETGAFAPTKSKTVSDFSPQTTHVMRPTASFAAQARESRKMRKDMAEKPAQPSFQSTVRGGVSRPTTTKATSAVDVSSDDSDYDERLIREALAKAKKEGKLPGPKPAGAPSGSSSAKRKKRSSGPSKAGPDFRDI